MSEVTFSPKAPRSVSWRYQACLVWLFSCGLAASVWACKPTNFSGTAATKVDASSSNGGGGSGGGSGSGSGGGGGSTGSGSGTGSDSSTDAVNANGNGGSGGVGSDGSSVGNGALGTANSNANNPSCSNGCCPSQNIAFVDCSGSSPNVKAGNYSIAAVSCSAVQSSTSALSAYDTVVYYGPTDYNGTSKLPPAVDTALNNGAKVVAFMSRGAASLDNPYYSLTLEQNMEFASGVGGSSIASPNANAMTAAFSKQTYGSANFNYIMFLGPFLLVNSNLYSSAMEARWCSDLTARSALGVQMMTFHGYLLDDTSRLGVLITSTMSIPNDQTGFDFTEPFLAAHLEQTWNSAGNSVQCGLPCGTYTGNVASSGSNSSNGSAGSLGSNGSTGSNGSSGNGNNGNLGSGGSVAGQGNSGSASSPSALGGSPNSGGSVGTSPGDAGSSSPSGLGGLSGLSGLAGGSSPLGGLLSGGTSLLSGASGNNPGNGFTNATGIGKPVIYLYPASEQEVTVKLDFAGQLVTTYPKYDPTVGGWQVRANPQGQIFDHSGQEFSSIYWNGTTTQFAADLSTGFVVKGEDSRHFLQEKLAFLGLTPREANDMIVYWLPYMERHPYNIIHFAGAEYTSIAQLTIEPTPDALLRVFMVYQGIAAPIQVAEQKLAPFSRHGFTAVEWGGTEIGGDWHVVQ